MDEWRGGFETVANYWVDGKRVWDGTGGDLERIRIWEAEDGGPDEVVKRIKGKKSVSHNYSS